MTGHRVLLVGNFPAPGAGAFSSCALLCERLSGAGWDVLATSSRGNAAARVADMVTTAWRRRRDYDVAQVDVFSGRAFLWAEAVCGALRAARRPFVLVLRGGNLPAFARRWPGRVARLLRSASAVVAPSRYLLERMRGYARQITLIPNGVPTSAYAFRLRGPAAPRLVWVRAFHRVYNPALAVEVLARLVAEGSDATLAMVGRDKDGSLAAVRRLAGERGVAQRLTLPGGVPNAEIARWLDDADVFLNTTDVDNTPVSVLEAMAAGLPVVSTDAGGLPQLLRDGRDALLVPRGDCGAMAAAVRRVVAQPTLARRLSRHAGHVARHYDWGAVLPRWERLLEETSLQRRAA